MPIYMDRHDVPEIVTAEYVAQLHQQDLKTEAKFGCKGLTYWFDGIRKMAFCLFEAPNMQAVSDLHHAAHGSVPNYIIEVDAKIVESFLGRITDPAGRMEIATDIIDEPAFRTIMLIHFENHPGKSVEEKNTFHEARESFRSQIQKIITQHSGNMVKHNADSCVISFTSASKAFNAALNIQNLKQHTPALYNVSFDKISLTAGVPVTERPQLFEEALKLAQIFSLVKGEVVISSVVAGLLNGENATTASSKQYLSFMTSTDEKFLTLLADFIETHWRDSNLKVDDMAKKTACSKSKLYRRIKFLAGVSPNDLINKYRLEKAYSILNTTEKTVSEVAFEVGFTSPSYFTKCFQKKYAYRPSNYLRERRETANCSYVQK